MKEDGDRQVVVLAGGLATRLRNLGDDPPKALRPVGGRPFLDLMLESLSSDGFHRFHFCLGNRGEQIARHLGMLEPGLQITIEVEPTPQGTAGALMRSTAWLDDVFLLVMGDTYLELDYDSLFDLLPASADGLLVVTKADSEVVPNVLLAESRVVAYDKGGVGKDWTDTGVAVLRRRSLDLLEDAEPPLDLTALFLAMIERGSLRAAVTDRRFHDIGTPGRYRRLDLQMAARAPEAMPGC